MISEQARQGFDHLLIEAIKGGLVAPDDVCDVQSIEDADEIKDQKIVILTISSYLFRVMVSIYFSPTKSIREHIGKLNKTAAGDLSEKAFYDAIAECGNICCGALNRGLGKHFNYIGMSTPNILDRACASYLNILGCGYAKHVRFVLNDSTEFCASLSVCDYADLDFTVETDAQDEASAGELEFF